MSMQSSLRINLLGGFKLEQGGRMLLAPTHSRVRLLIAYLLLHPRREHQRTFLAGLLNPDMPESAALRRLSQTLWHARQIVNSIKSSRHSIRLEQDATYKSDVGVFVTLLQQAENATGQDQIDAWEQALALYSGPLLPGYYEDWLLVARERLRDRFLDVLLNLIQAYSRIGNYERALLLARRLADAEPLNESAHGHIIRFCALLGRGHEALQQYDYLQQILRDELGVRPGAAVQQLMRQVQQQISPRADSDTFRDEMTLQLPMVGRDRVWAQMQRMLARLRAGAGDILIIRGESGIGKTRLQTELSQYARWSNIQIWTASTCREVYPEPYCLWRQAILPQLTTLRIEQLQHEIDDYWLIALTPIFPVIKEALPHLPTISHLEGAETLQRQHEALQRLLTVFARQAPLLILFDDTQWADAASLELLQNMTAIVREQPLLMALNFSDDNPQDSHRLDVYLSQFSVSPTVIHLHALSPAASDQLIQVALDMTRPAPRFQQRLYQATQGHPLFLLETLWALRDQGALYRNEMDAWSTPWDGATEDYSELPLSSRLQEFFEARLEQLSPAAQDIIQIAALTTGHFDSEFLRATAAVSSDTLVYATDELLRHHLLVTSSHAFSLVHDSVRTSVQAVMDEKHKRQVHYRIAHAFIQQGDKSPAQIAYHLDHAGVWPEAIHYHSEAAKQALAANGFTSAREHLDVAIALTEKTGSSDSVIFDLLEQREIVLNMLGEREGQLADIEAMLTLAGDDDARCARILLRRARLHLFISRFDLAEADAQEARLLAGKAGNNHDELIANIMFSQACIFRGEYELALKDYDHIIRLAHTMDQPIPQAQTNQVMANALLGLERYAEAREHLDRALHLFMESEDRRGEADVLHLLAILATKQGDNLLAHEYYQRELTICKQIGFLYGESKALFNIGNLYFLEGSYYPAQQHYEAAAQLFRRLKIPRGEMMALFNHAAIRLTMFGAEESTLSDINTGLALTEDIGDVIGKGQGSSLLAGYYFHGGDLIQAQAYSEKGIGILLEMKQSWMALQDMPLLIDILLARDEVDAALAHLSRVEEMARDDESPANAKLQALQARAHWRKGDHIAARHWAQKAMMTLQRRVNQGHLAAYWCMKVFQGIGDEKRAEEALIIAWEMLQHMLAGFSPELRKKSLARRPAHRHIAKAYQGLNMMVTTLLAMADAPTGRPLTPEECVTVRWTIHSPEDRRITGKVALRHHRLRRLAGEAEQAGAAPTVDDLASALGVSRATIKRDMAAMRRAGAPLRTRGNRG
jgi:predicted ATPase/DNA-binding SARP family transcriptional activator